MSSRYPSVRDQRGVATLLLVAVLGAILLLAVARLATQRQLELRALSGDSLYASQLLQAEATLAMAAEAERQLGSTTLVVPAQLQRTLVDGQGHPEWPLDQLLELRASSSSALSRAEVRQWLWSRPLVKGLPPAPLTVQGSLSLGGLAVAGGNDGQSLVAIMAGSLPAAMQLQRCAPSLLVPACPSLWLLPAVAESASQAQLLANTFGLGLPWLGQSSGFSHAAGSADACTTRLRDVQALWWRGDCLLDDGPIGSPQQPRLLLIEDGQLRLAPGVRVNALLVMAGESGRPLRLDWGQGAVLQGAVVVAGDAIISGTPRIWFDGQLLTRLQQSLRVVEVVPGSWRDW